MRQVVVVCARPEPVALKIKKGDTVKPCRPDPRQELLPTEAIQVRESDNTVLINGILANIREYEIIVPEKVMKITFMDGSTEKTVLKKGDTFSVEAGLRIAIAKHVGRRDYNLAGIENLANRLSYLKCIDKMISKVMREYNQNQKQLKKLEENQRELEAAKARKARKAALKRARRAVNEGQNESGCCSHSCRCEESSHEMEDEAVPREARERNHAPNHLNITRSPHRGSSVTKVTRNKNDRKR